MRWQFRGGDRAGIGGGTNPEEFQAFADMILVAVVAANVGAQPVADPGLGIALDRLPVVMDRTTRGKVNNPRFDDSH